MQVCFVIDTYFEFQTFTNYPVTKKIPYSFREHLILLRICCHMDSDDVIAIHSIEASFNKELYSASNVFINSFVGRAIFVETCCLQKKKKK